MKLITTLISDYKSFLVVLFCFVSDYIRPPESISDNVRERETTLTTETTPITAFTSPSVAATAAVDSSTESGQCAIQTYPAQISGK